MPLLALRDMLQEMAVGLRSANPLAARFAKNFLTKWPKEAPIRILKPVVTK
jgi:hypothetical protein